jgi:hypothetical protein
MMEEMTEAEFRGWLKFHKVEPFGEELDWLKFGTIASVVANVNRDAKKTEPFTPEMFVPEFIRRKQTPKENSRAIRNSLMSAFGGRIKDKGDGDGK